MSADVIPFDSCTLKKRHTQIQREFGFIQMMMTTKSSRGIYFIFETVQSPKNISQINILYYMIMFPLKLRIQET